MKIMIEHDGQTVTVECTTTTPALVLERLTMALAILKERSAAAKSAVANPPPGDAPAAEVKHNGCAPENVKASEALTGPAIEMLAKAHIESDGLMKAVDGVYSMSCGCAVTVKVQFETVQCEEMKKSEKEGA